MAKQLVVAIVGSRTLGEWDLVTAFVDHLMQHYPESKFISGGAKGVDAMAAYILREKHGVEVEVVKADWETNGNGAGYARNWRLVMKADLVAALWDGESKGTKHTLDAAARMRRRICKWEVPALPQAEEA